MNESVVSRVRPLVSGEVLGRTIERTRLPLYRNALVLMLNSGLTAGLGFVFWTLAARLYPLKEVGLASAAISSTLFMATLAQLGLPYALVRFAPSVADRRVLASTVGLVVMMTGTLGGAIFVAGLDVWAPALGVLAARPVLATSVIALAGTSAASAVLLYVAVGGRDTRPALAGGITQGVVKSIVIVVAALTFSRLAIFLVLAWLLGTSAAVLLQMWLLRTQLARRVDLHLLRLGTFLRYSAANYGGDLAWTAPGLLFPLIVVGLLGAEANAYFYVAWAVAGLLAAIPTAVGSSLLAEGSHAHEETGAHLRRAFLLTLVLVVPAVGACWVAAPLLLGLFGAPYAAHGVTTLRVFSLAALPLSFNVLHLAVARVDRNAWRVLGIALATGGGALLLGAALATRQGATGIALGYLAAHSLVAVGLTVQWWLRDRARA